GLGLAAGATGSFTWTYSATADGSSIFTGWATGFDSLVTNRLVTTAVSTAPMTVNPPSAGLALLAPVGVPGLVGNNIPTNGGPFALTMTVQNTGTVAAASITPSTLADSPGGNISGVIDPPVVNNL